jgi:hypothetical protein
MTGSIGVDDRRQGSPSPALDSSGAKWVAKSEHAASSNAESSCDKPASLNVELKLQSENPAPTPSAKTDAPKYVKHEKYYFKDGSVKLLVRFHAYAFDTRYDEELVQVGDIMYNLHQTILEHHSIWLRGYFASPADTLQLGWTRHTGPRGDVLFVNHKLEQVSLVPPCIVDVATGAFILGSVSKIQFDTFLSILYPA